MTQPGHTSDYAATARAILAIKKHVEASDTFAQTLAGLLADGYDPARLHEDLRPPADADLHLHSKHSDGNLPPRKLVWVAKLMGLQAIAVADHDNLSGVAEAVQEGDDLGVRVVPACELSTSRAGCEILLYMPDAERFLDFIRSPASQPIRNDLEAVQRNMHNRTVAVIDDVNDFLQQQGVPAGQLVTHKELSDWFSGQKPFYYGTLAVLGLMRLDDQKRDELNIHDPRAFNTQVLQPALKKLPQAGKVRTPEEALSIAGQIRSAGVDVVAVLAHPRELETKGRMARPDVAPFIAQLAGNGLDGLEVACSRDTEADTAHWNAIADSLDATAPLLRCSFSSDFHVLNPGKAHGEITIAYGLLDEDHPSGNLRPQGTIDNLLESIVRKASQR